MKTPIYYIAYPDKSFSNPSDWDNYPIEGKLGGACIRDKDFKEWAHREEKFWNPVKIGVRPERRYFVVWRVMYRGGRASMTNCPSEDWHQIERAGPDMWENGACLLETVQDGEQAEEIGKQDSFWEPIDPEEIDRNQRMFRELKEHVRNHYPDAW